jgi:hypothetical protein
MRKEVCFSVGFCLIFDGKMVFQLHFRGFSRVNIFQQNSLVTKYISTKYETMPTLLPFRVVLTMALCVFPVLSEAASTEMKRA